MCSCSLSLLLIMSFVFKTVYTFKKHLVINKAFTHILFHLITTVNHKKQEEHYSHFIDEETQVQKYYSIIPQLQ